MNWLFCAARHVRRLPGRRRLVAQRVFLGEDLEPRRLLAQVAGNISQDTVWTLANSPYEVTGDVTVQAGVTLQIEPGVDVRFRANTGIQVRGQLEADGTADARIRFARVAGGGRWDGLSFVNTLAENRISYADMTGGDGQGEAINVDRSRLHLDHIVWSDTTGTILELNHPSLIVRNSQFPTSNGSEVVHGEHISGSEYLILEGNVFANSNNGGDVVDFLGADRPGPVLQVLNNIFLGGGDDGLDLDGTDAHIEGNVFMNFQKNTSRATTSNAIATGLPQTGEPNRTEITVVRNLFVNNDHAILLKEEAFARVENNVFVNSQLAAIQFNEVGGTAVEGVGKGAELIGNIFANNNQLFKNLVNTPAFKTLLTVDQSLLPNEVVNFGGTLVNAHDLGSGNIDGDPRFVDPAAGIYRLQSDSPAVASGPGGLDMGAYVPAGPTVVARSPASPDGSMTLDVAGPGITHYRYRLDGQPLGPLTPVGEPIQLQGLAGGPHAVEVVGMNSAGEWVTGQTAAWQEHAFQLLAPTRVRAGETLPIVSRALNWQGTTDAALTDLRSLVLGGGQGTRELLFKKGVAAATAPVTAGGSFELSLQGSTRDVELLPADFPVENVSGTLAGDITWTADREYRIASNLTIPAGSRLTIEAGTRVLLGPAVNVLVNGQLQSQGTADQPVLLTAAGDAAWGGLEFVDAQPSQLQFTFLTQGGGDASKVFGHSNSQPLLRVNRSTLTCDNCFIVDNAGKGFGTTGARVNIFNSVIANVDTGGEFGTSVVRVKNSWLMNIPNDQRTFVDDDNDGFYFSSTHSSGEASRFEDSYVINTKDDGLDHNGARLEVVRAWIQGAFHEGLAASNSEWATVTDSVFTGNNQGVEAGYGGPLVTVTQSVMVDNRNQVDPGSPITAGLRFGDGYNGSNGNYTGHITAVYDVLHNNGDNVRNYDGTIPGPQAGAIDITSSLANDADATDPSNLSGQPVFSPSMHLLRGSAGFTAGPDGMPLGRVVPATRFSFVIPSSGDFNGDGTIDAADIDLLCAALNSADPASIYDLTGDGVVDEADRDEMIFGRLQTTYGDANLDRVFNSSDLVGVLAAGEYEDNVSNNSGWAEGDWNCDGDFSTQDLVLALATGGYVAAAVDQAGGAWQPASNLSDLAAAILDAEPTKKIEA
jgi:hypothetical protein